MNVANDYRLKFRQFRRSLEIPTKVVAGYLRVSVGTFSAFENLRGWLSAGRRHRLAQLLQCAEEERAALGPSFRLRDPEAAQRLVLARSSWAPPEKLAATIAGEQGQN